MTINYQHPVTRVSSTLALVVTVLHPFSLTKEAFNPSIWEKGSFDENTRTLITGRYGFGGWQFSVLPGFLGEKLNLLLIARLLWNWAMIIRAVSLFVF